MMPQHILIRRRPLPPKRILEPKRERHDADPRKDSEKPEDTVPVEELCEDTAEDGAEAGGEGEGHVVDAHFGAAFGGLEDIGEGSGADGEDGA